MPKAGWSFLTGGVNDDDTSLVRLGFLFAGCASRPSAITVGPAWCCPRPALRVGGRLLLSILAFLGPDSGRKRNTRLAIRSSGNRRQLRQRDRLGPGRRLDPIR